MQVAEVARREDGVISRERLLGLGLSRFSIRRRVDRGYLHELWPGVYAVGHPRVTARGRARAAILTCGPQALMSHRSAAWLWDLLPDSRRIFDVTVPGRPGMQRRGIRLHKPRGLDIEDRGEIHGLPVTSVARTLFDVAETEGGRHARRAFEEAERRRVFDLDDVRGLIARSRGRRGRNRVIALLAEWDGFAPDTRQELERRFVELCREHGLPEPATNVMVAGHCVDAHWPGTDLVVELDSWSFHGTRTAFERDRRRAADLKLAGYEVLPVTWRWLTQEPAAVAAAVRKLLG